ncbi:MAG: TA system VapC family ribonuclease toxin [Terrimicrobiaceae bacterium]
MILPDINVLLYAYNPHVPQHAAARAWWEGALNGEELIGLPNEVLFGFVRIATHPRLGAAAASLTMANRAVETWLSQPHVRLLSPEPDHFVKTIELMKKTKSSGATTSDAVLAVYALAQRATLHTNDTDFARFPGLDWKNPLTVSNG